MGAGEQHRQSAGMSADHLILVVVYRPHTLPSSRPSSSSRRQPSL
jgi:hypothetical protein